MTAQPLRFRRTLRHPVLCAGLLLVVRLLLYHTPWVCLVSFFNVCNFTGCCSHRGLFSVLPTSVAENALLEDLAKRLEELLRIMRRLHGTTEWIPELSSRSDTPGRRPPPPSREPTAEGAAMTMGLVNVTGLAVGGSTLAIGSGEGTRGMQSPLVSSTVPTPDSNHHRWI